MATKELVPVFATGTNFDKMALAKVPSIVIPEEVNYLINPESNKLSKITILDARDFIFDVRIKG